MSNGGKETVGTTCTVLGTYGTLMGTMMLCNRAPPRSGVPGSPYCCDVNGGGHGLLAGSHVDTRQALASSRHSPLVPANDVVPRAIAPPPQYANQANLACLMFAVAPRVLILVRHTRSSVVPGLFYVTGRELLEGLLPCTTTAPPDRASACCSTSPTLMLLLLLLQGAIPYTSLSP